MPAPASAYPDDLHQNREDRRHPPIRQAQALSGHAPARQTQGQSATGPAPGAPSPLAGRDLARGELPEGEPHWDAPLPVVVRLAQAGGVELRTLRQAGAFASGHYLPLAPSPSLQTLAIFLLAAARSGHPDDLADAGLHLQTYVRLLRTN